MLPICRYLCGKETIMAITIKQGLSGKYFSMGVPDMACVIDGYRMGVKILISPDNTAWTEIYSEYLYPLDGSITLADLGSLLNPYARQMLVVYVKVKMSEEFADSTSATTQEQTFTLVYCEADIPTTCEDFTTNHFLSLLLGAKLTAPGRLEYLHFIGTDTATCTATYTDGSTQAFTPVVIGGNGSYTTIDVSPGRFTAEGKTLASYTVTAGNRRQQFDIDFRSPDCAPVLLFTNSFGCDELFYCTGVATKAPTFKRDSAYIDGKKRNYRIQETRTFKADTGPMNEDMADWFGELMRSPYVRLVTFNNGQPNIGREIVIDDSKTEQNNALDEIPRFTFSYEYAQRNHNVVELERVGRIFDNTFDYTFN